MTSINMSQFGVCHIPPGYRRRVCACVRARACIGTRTVLFSVCMHLFFSACVVAAKYEIRLWKRGRSICSFRLWAADALPSQSHHESDQYLTVLHFLIQSWLPTSDVKSGSRSRLFVSLRRVVFNLSALLLLLTAAYRLYYYLKLHARVRCRAFPPL